MFLSKSTFFRYSHKIFLLSLFILLNNLGFSQSSDKSNSTAKIVVMRNSGNIGSLTGFSFYMDMRRKAKVRNKRYVTFEIESGTHKFMATFSGGQVLNRKYEYFQGEYNFEAGKTYYFYLDIIPHFWTNSLKVVELSERNGRGEINSGNFREQN
jgi:hypothetical protein